MEAVIRLSLDLDHVGANNIIVLVYRINLP